MPIREPSIQNFNPALLHLARQWNWLGNPRLRLYLIPIHKYSNMRKVMKKYIKCFQSQISVYKYEVLKSQSDERAKNFQFCIVNNYSFHYQIFRQLLYYSSKYTFFARVGQKQILYRAKSTSTRFWFCLQKSKRNFPLEDSCALYWVMGDSFFFTKSERKINFLSGFF